MGQERMGWNKMDGNWMDWLAGTGQDQMDRMRWDGWYKIELKKGWIDGWDQTDWLDGTMDAWMEWEGMEQDGMGGWGQMERDEWDQIEWFDAMACNG